MQGKGLNPGPEHICAVVVTFNRMVLLEECLTALSSQTRLLDEIIVIDNASTDGTESLFRTRFVDATYKRLKENVGGSGGFYEGIKLAFSKGHDWIWIMDDDAIPMADALQKLLDCPVRLRDGVYALASSVLNRDGTICLMHRRLFDAHKMAEAIVEASRYEQDYFQMDTASFVGLLLSRQTIEDIGLPLKEMFIYYDDTEYSLRIRRRGIMATVPASKIVHGEPKRSLQNSAGGQSPTGWRKYYVIRNSIYTYMKYGKPSIAFYMRLFRELLNGIIGALRSGTDKSYSLKINLYGVFDGLRGKLGKNHNFLPS